MNDLFKGHSVDTHCKHPLKAWKVGTNPETGKDKLKVTSYDVKYLMFRYNPDTGLPMYGKCYSDELKERYSSAWTSIDDYIEIPCGHCISCRLRYSKDWANRMMLEAKEHESNYFLTLTYDNEHLPEPLPLDEPWFSADTGECFEQSPVHPLVKRDIQLFMKRLRDRFPDQKIRFYACGEYGSKNMRPHYHLILFGLKLDDLQDFDVYYKDYGVRGTNELGQKYFASPTIDSCWHKQGIHSLAEVTWETCAYTARYVTKKLNGDQADIYSDFNFPREWSLCSRKPGIARNYYDLHKDEIYKNDEMFLNLGVKGGRRIKPPKYYDKLFDIDYPDEMGIIKGKRKEIAEANARLKDSLSSLTYQEQLAVDEQSLIARTKILQRKDL